MKLKLRTRVNDVKNNSFYRGEFIHFDNCVQVEIGRTSIHNLEDKKQDSEYRRLTGYYGSVGPKQMNNNTGKEFDEVIYMIRDLDKTQYRLEKEIETNPEFKTTERPFHLNIIDWKDRVTGKYHRLVFDTVVFLQNDQGDTLEKIEG